MEFREEPNRDLAIIPGSPKDFHRFLGVRVPGKRRHLYKYSRVSACLLESLREGYLWLSKPSEFNDPFDCKIVIDYRLTPEELQQHVHVRDSGSSNKERRVIKLRGEGQYAFASRFAIDASDIDSGDPRSLALNIAKLAERSEFLDRTMGLCCFTEDPRSILMWSHYAANHSGVCLRFRHRSSSDLSEHCFPVQYRRSVWSCRSKADDPIAQARALIRGSLIKSEVWRYEREWRVVAFGSGKSHFDPKDLDGVILGVQISKRDRRAILSILRKKVYSHVELLQAYQHPLKYGVRILPESER